MDASPFERVLAALENVCRAGRKATARCPAHEDTHNSLSITEAEDRRVLLHCFVGCPPDKVVTAAGLTMADLFPQGGSRPQMNIVATYDYESEDGALLFQVVRLQPKDFRVRRPGGKGGWTWNLHGVQRVLYRLPEVTAAVSAGRSVYVVEGEKDADALNEHFRDHSIPAVATCNPGGAGNWLEAFSSVLAGATVVLVADKDETDLKTGKNPGMDHARDVLNSLHGVATSVSVVVAAAGKDAFDHLAAGHSVDEFVPAPPFVEGPNSTSDAGQHPPDSVGGDARAPDPDELLKQSGLMDLDEAAPLAWINNALHRLATLVRELDSISRGLVREGAIRKLRAIKVSAPAKLVDAALPPPDSSCSGEGDEGRSLKLRVSPPADEPVDGAELLDAIEETIRRFVVLPDGAAEAIALWVVHSYALDAFFISPILAILSAVKRCGKTTLLEILAALVPAPLPASNISAAAVYRSIEKYHPTLLVDEGDSFLEGKGDLRGVLNSGQTRTTAKVVRCLEPDFDPMLFSTWAAKAIALIGRPPDTIEDRSVVIKLRRKHRGEQVAPIRRDRIEDEIEPLRRDAARWKNDHLDKLRVADPIVPEALQDRAADNWRPLLAIADLAGGHWPARARQAAIHLAAGGEQDEEPLTLLLSDLRDLFERTQSAALFSTAIIEELVKLEERPWPEWGKAKRPLTPTQLARLLRRLDIRPGTVRIGPTTAKGYQLDWFQDAFARYLPSEPSHPSQPSNDGPNPDSPNRHTTPGVTPPGTGENPRHHGNVTGVTAEDEEPEQEEPPKEDGTPRDWLFADDFPEDPPAERQWD